MFEGRTREAAPLDRYFEPRLVSARARRGCLAFRGEGGGPTTPRPFSALVPWPAAPAQTVFFVLESLFTARFALLATDSISSLSYFVAKLLAFEVSSGNAANDSIASTR